MYRSAQKSAWAPVAALLALLIAIAASGCALVGGSSAPSDAHAKQILDRSREKAKSIESARLAGTMKITSSQSAQSANVTFSGAWKTSAPGKYDGKFSIDVDAAGRRFTIDSIVVNNRVFVGFGETYYEMPSDTQQVASSSPDLYKRLGDIGATFGDKATYIGTETLDGIQIEHVMVALNGDDVVKLYKSAYRQPGLSAIGDAGALSGMMNKVKDLIEDGRIDTYVDRSSGLAQRVVVQIKFEGGGVEGDIRLLDVNKPLELVITPPSSVKPFSALEGDLARQVGATGSPSAP